MQVALETVSSQEKVFQIRLLLHTLESVMIGPGQFLKCLKASFLLSQCQVLGFFLMAFISGEIMPALAPTLHNVFVFIFCPTATISSLSAMLFVPNSHSKPGYKQ
jgi:hypothetical protein